MTPEERIRIAVNLLCEAIDVLTTPELEEHRRWVILTPGRVFTELSKIGDIAERTLNMVINVSNIVAKTLKSSCPGCDRDLMLIIEGNNIILECYNPDYNEHNNRGISATKWTLTPTQVR
ncbi:MAG: hypothetical protein ACQXXJ_01280 [Candidatus Bathyarchaeia archaeon]|jgi:hypothetical protein